MLQIYDTTLRDGAQSVGVNFSLEDKLLIVKKLDELGVDYIEGGWPHASNIKEVEFFKRVKNFDTNAKIAAFGCTKKPNSKIEEDQFINNLIDAQTKVVTIFGKSWDLHVDAVLRTTLENNLIMIKESVEYLKSAGKEVIFDAEHFFDGYKANKDYTLQTILAAQSAGADMIVFCDTNGGCLPEEIEKIIQEVKEKLQIPFGVHCHNDSGLAVANSLKAIHNGAVQIQGTINGYGERCGNVDLCTLIPNLKLKMGIDVATDEQLSKLKSISNLVSSLANKRPFEHYPYVGEYAFTHKGGMHIDAVLKNKKTFEHIEPELVGNSTDWLVSEQAGKGIILAKLKELGFSFEKGSPEIENILSAVKEKEALGFTYEAAPASFKLLVLKILNKFSEPFAIDHYEIITKKLSDNETESIAKVCLRVGENVECSKAIGRGPINALDLALRQVLSKFYPEVDKIELVDYKVCVLSSTDGTAANVRVLIQFADQEERWGTVDVADNIIEASWQALLEGFYYKLVKI
ncbi:MAG: citramalate synthase [bacterium]